jgi:hypothetical protein
MNNNLSEYPFVLDVSHVQEILNIGRRQAYELFHSGEFHIVKVGNRLKVSKQVFLSWLNGNQSTISA